MNAQTRTIFLKKKKLSTKKKISPVKKKKKKKTQERHQIRNRMSFRRPAGNKDIDSSERMNQMNALDENSTSLDPFLKRQFITRSRLEV
jgi:hypothetical protein